ncbi:MAG: methylated-DNA--[protein]-cysteine S-methyltransferase [Marmoricola sp.]
MDRLRAGLVTDSARAGILDVAYCTLDTPVGSMLLAATEQGLVRVAFDCEDHDSVLQGLAERISPRVLRARARLDLVAHQIDEYFVGTRRTFEIPLDLRLATRFRLEVLRHLTDIGYGHTESYTQVATSAGSPRAVRAVGSACANNPLPVVVPCHRVVRADASIGGYIGGLDAKHTLLSLEGAAA